MDSVIGPIILGIFISILGMNNMKGNISSLHWYHRHRVTEENIMPFGRMIGLGTIIIGVSVVLYGCFSLAAEILQNDFYIMIGSIIVIVGIIAGLILSCYAMIKYNKGIF